jgi:sec-independent protein translocase protein TatA
MIPGFHGFDLIIILVIALLIFGPKRLPEMGSAIGKSIKEFRKGMAELTSPKDTTEEEQKLPISTRDMNKPGSNTVNSDLASHTPAPEASEKEAPIE